MAKDINLLPDIALEEEREQKVKKLVTLVSVIILLLTIVSVIVVFSVQLFLQRELDKVVEVNNKLRSDIVAFAELEGNYRSLKSKTSSIKTIRAEGKNYELYFSRILELLPDGISLTNLNVSESDIVTVTGEANASETVNVLIKNLLSDEQSDEGLFTAINANNISLSQDGEFQFSITMAIKE